MSSTVHIFTPSPARLVTTVSAIIPRISSISAAPRIAFPARVESFPSSLRVSTVIETEVAVRTIPIKINWRVLEVGRLSFAPILNAHASPKPPARGTRTPSRAIRKDAFPVF